MNTFPRVNSHQVVYHPSEEKLVRGDITDSMSEWAIELKRL